MEFVLLDLFTLNFPLNASSMSFSLNEQTAEPEIPLFDVVNVAWKVESS